MTFEKGNKLIEDKKIDMCTFAQLFLANPDLPTRFKNEVKEFNPPRYQFFYTGGEQGYIDYPRYKS